MTATAGIAWALLAAIGGTGLITLAGAAFQAGRPRLGHGLVVVALVVATVASCSIVAGGGAL